jgi:hypothetical protein
MKKLLLLLLLSVSQPGMAETALLDEPVQDPRVSIQTIEPDRAVGYVVGDRISRTIKLTVKKPYQLLDTSLPIVGYEKRWKGQVSGIELRDISKETSVGSDSTTYTLHLTYQVFTTNVVAKPSNLPAEVIKFSGNKEIFEYRIPSWNFRISPLAVYGSVVIERDMSPFRGPLLLDDSQEQLTLKLLLGSGGIALLGLLYILGRHAWLPRMGGPFARAYRDLRRLRKQQGTEQGLQQAVQRVHQALNASAGNSVFNAESFISRKPAFAGLKPELEQFFSLSRAVFFDAATTREQAQPETWLRQFCLSCRNVERGLK